MKKVTCLFLVTLFCSHARAQDIPSGFRLERYAALWERNPFTLVMPVSPAAQRSPFDKLFLASWLIDNGRQVVFIQNSESGQVEKVTAEPNQNNIRLVEMHFDANPRLVEALLSNGKEQGAVRFRFDAGVPNGSQAPPVTAQMEGRGGTSEALPVTKAAPAAVPASSAHKTAEQKSRYIHTVPLRSYNGGG